ncbi:MAG: hypothetical protein LBR95_06505 [Azoarcus sp.]|jgi:hypothetical protein|nr:hypothetical protein [Azoarcus sp.]
MVAKVLPASAGWQWWKSTVELLLRAPVPLALFTLLFVVIFFVVSFVMIFTAAFFGRSLPTLAFLLSSLVFLAIAAIAPPFFLGLLSIFRGVDRGEKISLDLFLQAFRERRTPLGVLGLLLAVFCWAGQVFAMHVSGLGIVGLLSAPSDASSLFPLWTEFVESMRLFMLLNLFVLAVYGALFWFSLFLVGWRDAPIAAALKESFMATVKNWAPFLVSLLVLTVGTIALFIVPGIAFAILGFLLPGVLVSFLAFIVTIGAITISFSLLYGFWYITYKTIFEEQTLEAGTA